jgi:acyl-CoA thioesterase YciA
MIEEAQPPKEAPTIRVTAMPCDTNPYGDIFGGWLMGQMDWAASSHAARHAGGRTVTVAVDGMSFIRPVFVGDELSVYTRIIKQGRTSLTIHTEAWSRARDNEHINKVTEAKFVFVAIGQDRRPRPIASAATDQVLNMEHDVVGMERTKKRSSRG